MTFLTSDPSHRMLLATRCRSALCGEKGRGTACRAPTISQQCTLTLALTHGERGRSGYSCLGFSSSQRNTEQIARYLALFPSTMHWFLGALSRSRAMRALPTSGRRVGYEEFSFSHVSSSTCIAAIPWSMCLLSGDRPFIHKLDDSRSRSRIERAGRRVREEAGGVANSLDECAHVCRSGVVRGRHESVARRKQRRRAQPSPPIQRW